MSGGRIDVRIGDRVVGELRVEPDGDYRFTYREGLTDDLAVSLVMPTRERSLKTQVVPPPLTQHLPEGVLREYLLTAVRKSAPRDLHDPGASDEIRLMRLVGNHLVGRVRIGEPVGETPDALDMEQAAGDLPPEASARFLEECLDRFAVRSGISGVQPKVLADGRPEQRTTLVFDRAVLKFEPADYPGLAVNEFFCLEAARQSGLDTVECELSGDGRRLILDRFDRDAGGSPLGHEDFCALSFLPPNGKYNGDYRDLVHVVDQYLPAPRRIAARSDVFTLIAVSMMIGNGDAHLKNFGVLYDDPTGEVRLAPAYDLVCTTVYLPRDLPALSVDGDKRWPDRNALVRLGRAFGLRPREAGQLIERAAHGVRAAGEGLLEYAREHPGRQELAERVVRRFNRGLARCGGEGVAPVGTIPAEGAPQPR